MISVNAQVHIGDNANPHEGAILDLTNSSNLGLKLPIVTLQNAEYLQVDGKPDTDQDLTATGMTVYSKNKFALDGIGIYVWDGNLWNGIATQGKVGDGTVFPVPVCSQGYIPDAVFAPYNLGANIAKLDSIAAADHISKTKAAIRCSVIDFAAVCGDLYQWGRIADGHEKLNSPTVTVSNATYDTATGQVTDVNHKGYFITNSNSASSADWHIPEKRNLWGNGIEINVPTSSGVPGTDGQYYQSTEWQIPANNPCPAGFRVPTQDEWEHIVNYDCDPADGFSPSTIMTISSDSRYYYMTNMGLTWVRVKDGKASSTSWSYGENTGWAVYNTTVWDASAAAYKNGSTFLYAAAAPEPMLFLPAAGFRDPSNGNIATGSGGIGLGGSYWSSSFFTMTSNLGISGRNFYFADEVAGRTYSKNASGLSVRCVAE
jgi:hypothetical protein